MPHKLLPKNRRRLTIVVTSVVHNIVPLCCEDPGDCEVRPLSGGVGAAVTPEPRVIQPVFFPSGEWGLGGGYI